MSAAVALVSGDAAKWLAASAAAGAAAALVASVAVMVGRRTAAIERRLAGYELAVTPGAAASPTALGAETAMVRHGVDLTARVAARTGLLARTERLLEQADVPVRAEEVLFYAPMFGVLAGLLGAVLVSPVAGLVVGGVVPAAPFAAVWRRRSMRLRRFELLLPPTLTLLASSMRSGFSFLQGLETAAAEARDPIRRELQRVLTEVRLGRDLEDAMLDVAERMRSRDLAWTVMAIRIQREVGGNLAALLDTVADTMSKRAQLRREVAALTAEGRISAIVLSIFPPVAAFMMYAVRGDYFAPLFERALGWVAIAGAVVMNVAGWLWLRRIVDIEG